MAIESVKIMLPKGSHRKRGRIGGNIVQNSNVWKIVGVVKDSLTTTVGIIVQ